MNGKYITIGVLASVWLLGCGSGTSDGPEPLVIGMDATYRPFEFVDEAGEMTGVSVAIGDAIGEQLGRPVVYRNINFDGLITAMKTGSVDLILSSMTATAERAKSIAFSDPYVKTGLSILTPIGSALQSSRDLRKPGSRVVVRIGTTGEQWVRESLPEVEVVRLDTDAACVLEVVNASVDAWVYDQISIMNYHAQYPDSTRALLTPLREEFWAVGMPLDVEPALRDGVNATLRKLRQTGGMDAIAERFLAVEQRLMKEQGLPFVFQLE